MVGNFILHYSELFLQWLEIHQKHSIITCPKPSFANRLAHRLAPFGICSFHSINVTFVYFRLNIVMVFKIVCRMGRHWFSLDICSSHHRSRYRLRQLPLRTLRLNVPWSFRAVWCFCRQDPWGRWKIHGLWRIGILYRCACNVENTATQQNWIRRACNMLLLLLLLLLLPCRLTFRSQSSGWDHRKLREPCSKWCCTWRICQQKTRAKIDKNCPQGPQVVPLKSSDGPWTVQSIHGFHPLRLRGSSIFVVAFQPG